MANPNGLTLVDGGVQLPNGPEEKATGESQSSCMGRMYTFIGKHYPTSTLGKVLLIAAIAAAAYGIGFGIGHAMKVGGKTSHILGGAYGFITAAPFVAYHLMNWADDRREKARLAAEAAKDNVPTQSSGQEASKTESDETPEERRAQIVAERAAAFSRDNEPYSPYNDPTMPSGAWGGAWG